MAAVAEEAGVSKALLHYYFSTRQELLHAAFAFSSRIWEAAVLAQLAGAPSGAKRVELYLLASVSSTEPYDEHRALYNEVWSSLRIDSELRPLVRDAYRAWVDKLVALIGEGQADGSVATEVIARATAQRLAAVVDGLDSMLYLGLADRRKARQLLRESLERELAA
jgi:AcrR family transcriptional regulator